MYYNHPHPADEETGSRVLSKALGLVMGFLITLRSTLILISTNFAFVLIYYIMTLFPSGTESQLPHLLCLCILVTEENILCFSNLKI